MERVLLLTNKNTNEYFPNEKDVIIRDVYKNNSYGSRVIRKVLVKTHFFTDKLLYSHLDGVISQSDVIILFDIGNTIAILKYLTKFKDKRLIYWYWNPVEATSREVIDQRDKFRNVEIWTYNENDAVKYGLKLNTQFYFLQNIDRVSEIKAPVTDALFVGADKNRSGYVLKLMDMFKKLDIDALFYITKGNTVNKNIEYKPMLKYPDLLSYVMNTKAVLDISKKQPGISLRPLEALYFKKKLITNNHYIKDLNLYNKDNVFILGRDNNAALKDFIDTPYNFDSYDSLCEYYSFRKWLERFEISI